MSCFFFIAVWMLRDASSKCYLRVSCGKPTSCTKNSRFIAFIHLSVVKVSLESNGLCGLHDERCGSLNCHSLKLSVDFEFVTLLNVIMKIRFLIIDFLLTPWLFR